MACYPLSLLCSLMSQRHSPSHHRNFIDACSAASLHLHLRLFSLSNSTAIRIATTLSSIMIGATMFMKTLNHRQYFQLALDATTLLGSSSCNLCYRQ